MRPAIRRNGVLLSRTVFPERLEFVPLCFSLQGNCPFCTLPFLSLCRFMGLSSPLVSARRHVNMLHQGCVAIHSQGVKQCADCVPICQRCCRKKHAPVEDASCKVVDLSTLREAHAPHLLIGLLLLGLQGAQQWPLQRDSQR